MTSTTPPPPLDQPAASQPAGMPRTLLHRWPILAALGLTAWIVLDLSNGSDLAPVLAGAAMVYLAAAALRNPATAWPLFGGAVLVILATELLVSESAPTWVLFGLAGLFLIYGLLRGAARPAGGLPLQTIGMVVFGIFAAAAVLVSGDVGAYLIAAGLLAHVAWDIYHYRANKVVPRSLAEFCMVLDTLVALAMVAVALRS